MAATGVPGMRERTAALGGSLQAGPRLGGGYRVRARLPHGERRARQPNDPDAFLVPNRRGGRLTRDRVGKIVDETSRLVTQLLRQLQLVLRESGERVAFVDTSAVNEVLDLAERIRDALVGRERMTA